MKNKEELFADSCDFVIKRLRVNFQEKDFKEGRSKKREKKKRALGKHRDKERAVRVQKKERKGNEYFRGRF
ncbi:hypothetical protein AGMMS50233_10550 [Endomicrobiia bacterium]|nr:hypothetical protein AGMMS50233_10550 [Endomicrobiia bacterium]